MSLHNDPSRAHRGRGQAESFVSVRDAFVGALEATTEAASWAVTWLASGPPASSSSRVAAASPRPALARDSSRMRSRPQTLAAGASSPASARVASTTSPQGWWWSDESESMVTVLERQGPELAAVGEVGGLGEGERIFAVRFMGEMGYVVTFRQTDPLYTIDLADPTTPRVAGELKISATEVETTGSASSYRVSCIACCG